MLLNVDITYEGQRSITFGINNNSETLPNNENGNVTVRRLAIAERATAVETLGVGRLLEYINTSDALSSDNFKGEERSLAQVLEIDGSSAVNDGKTSLELVQEALPVSWLDDMIKDLQMGHWDGVVDNNLNMNVFDVSSNKTALIKAIEIFVRDDKTNDQTANGLIDDGRTLSTSDVDARSFTHSSNYQKMSAGDKVLRITESGTEVYYHDGRKAGEDRDGVLSDVLADPGVLSSLAKYTFTEERSRIKQIRVEMKYDLSEGIGEVTNYVQRAVIQQPNPDQEASEGAFNNIISVNAWDGEESLTGLPTFTMDKVVTISSVDNVTAGFLLIDNSANALQAIETAAGNITNVAVGKNTIQIDVTPDSTGTLADTDVAGDILNLLDLSGIEVVESEDPEVVTKLGRGPLEERAAKVKAYLGTDGNESNFLFWEMVPHNDSLSSEAEFMSIKYDLSATAGINHSYPGSGNTRISGKGLESLSQHISLHAYEPGKYKVLIYMREGGVMRDEGPTGLGPLDENGVHTRSTGNLEVNLRTVNFGNENDKTVKGYIK